MESNVIINKHGKQHQTQQKTFKKLNNFRAVRSVLKITFKNLIPSNICLFS